MTCCGRPIYQFTSAATKELCGVVTRRVEEGFAVQTDGRFNRAVAVITLSLYSVFKILYLLTERHDDSYNDLVTATRVGRAATEGE